MTLSFVLWQNVKIKQDIELGFAWNIEKLDALSLILKKVDALLILFHSKPGDTAINTDEEFMNRSIELWVLL